jgi:hypothetical protein
MIGGWRQWLRIEGVIVMETASQTERDGKEKSGNNTTVPSIEHRQPLKPVGSSKTLDAGRRIPDRGRLASTMADQMRGFPLMALSGHRDRVFAQYAFVSTVAADKRRYKSRRRASGHQS